MKAANMVILVLMTKAFLTLIPIAIKYTQANIWTIGIFRLTLACFFFYFIVKKKVFLKDLKKIWALGPLFFIHWITYFLAIKTSTPSTAIIGLSSYGIILLFYSRLFFKTRLSFPVILCVILGLIGTFITVENFSIANSTFKGLLFGIASASAYAALPIIHQKYPLIPTRNKAFSQFLGAYIIFLMIGIPKTNWDLQINDYYALIYLAIGGTIIGHGLWVRITEKLSTTTTSAVYYLAIPISMLMENLILSIETTPRKILGGSIIILSNIFIILIKRRENEELL